MKHNFFVGYCPYCGKNAMCNDTGNNIFNVMCYNDHCFTNIKNKDTFNRVIIDYYPEVYDKNTFEKIYDKTRPLTKTIDYTNIDETDDEFIITDKYNNKHHINKKQIINFTK